MEDSKKERSVIVITTLAGLSCILQNYFGKWEFWVPIVILAWTVILWWLHLTQKINMNVRIHLCFVYSAFLVFYYGIHETSLYDVSISVALFMLTYIIVDNAYLLNLVLIEYAVVMGIQFYFLYKNEGTDLDAFGIFRILLHVCTILIMYIVCRVIVKRRMAEAKKELEWRNAVKANDNDMEDFLSNISHELRTPVNVISGMTTIIQKEKDSKELSSIQEACIRLAHQIEDIQDFTEIKRGELHIEEENYMCVSLINDVIANYKNSSIQHELELVTDISPDTPTMLKGDIQKLHKLFRHLLDNSIKFTKRGGIYIKLFSVPQDYGINLIIEITDTGVGMTRADISRVSKGMYQANKKRNRSTGGIGIGLPIVYGFVHKMGGFVNINSTKGHGTTVRISIPQQVVDPAPCLEIKKEYRDGLVFYVKPEKYKVPEIREFQRDMIMNLATGLKANMYSAGDRRELERLAANLKITHIFTGQDEYEADRDYLDELSRSGIKVAVAADDSFRTTSESGVIVMPRPLYAFPVVRIINGEAGIENYNDADKGKLMFTDVRALVVDDEPMNLVVASSLLRDYGMLVDTADGGAEAIKKYENGDYDVIYMDHMMPEMDGVEAMKIIRQVADSSYRKPVIIALTANALSGAREMFMREGFDGFVAKPIDIGEFERVMKNVLPEDMQRYEGRDE